MLKDLNLRQVICLGLVFAFFINTIGPTGIVWGQDYALPAPGVMVPLSLAFNPPVLKGIKVHPDNPFRFDFILDKGDSPLAGNQLKDESTKLIKYFLASLTIPEKDLWVNLSPYEKDRIIPQSFGLTEMGRDLLAEDYILKQVTASLIYPEGETGKKFWKRVYEEAQKKFGTTNIPVNTFNKVWIVPEKAVVFENAKAGTAYVLTSKLKVMLEQDYLSLNKHIQPSHLPGMGQKTVPPPGGGMSTLGSQIIREIVIPELTKEVNEGKNFSQLRQVYNSLILATWYKKKIKDLEQVYADKSKVDGVNIDDPQEKQKIYERYLQAFKKGVYNYIKEDVDSLTQQPIPRKYFSGGASMYITGDILETMTSRAMLPQGNTNGLEKIVMRLDQAMAQESPPFKMPQKGRIRVASTPDVPFEKENWPLSDDEGIRMGHVSDLIIDKLKMIIPSNNFSLQPNWEENNDNDDEWNELHGIFFAIAENLMDHEYDSDAQEFYIRVYPALQPYKGVRIELWGPGFKNNTPVDLPEQLTARRWYTYINPPWSVSGQAPKTARSKFSQGGYGITHLFYKIERIENISWMADAKQHIAVRWRDSKRNEGGRPKGHIISVQIPVFSALSRAMTTRKKEVGLGDRAMASPAHLELFRTLDGHQGEGVESIQYSFDSKHFISSGEDGEIHVWDASTGQKQTSLTARDYERDGGLGRMGFVVVRNAGVISSPDGKILAVEDTRHHIQLLDFPSLLKHEIKVLDDIDLGRFEEVFRLKFSNDNKFLFICAFYTKHVRGNAFNKTDVVLIYDLGLKKIVGHLPGKLGANFAPVSQDVWAVWQDIWNQGPQEVNFWNVKENRKEGPALKLADRFHAVIISPNKKIMAILPYSKAGVQIWSIPSRNLLRVIAPEGAYHRPHSFIYAADISPDNKELATGGNEGTVGVWDIETGKLLDLKEHGLTQVLGVRYRPDGRQLATSDFGGLIKLWTIDHVSRSLQNVDQDLVHFLNERRRTVLGTMQSIDKKLYATSIKRYFEQAGTAHLFREEVYQIVTQAVKMLEIDPMRLRPDQRLEYVHELENITERWQGVFRENIRSNIPEVVSDVYTILYEYVHLLERLLPVLNNQAMAVGQASNKEAGAGDGAMVNGFPVWDRPIQKMLRSGYTFLPEMMKPKGYVYRAVESGLINGLISGNFTYHDKFSPSTSIDPSEKKLGIYYLSHWLTEAFIFVYHKFYGDFDTGVLIIPSDFFNQEIREGRAAVHVNKYGEHRFPFLTRPPNIRNISYILVSPRFKQYLEEVKIGQRKLSQREIKLQKALRDANAPRIISAPPIGEVPAADMINYLNRENGINLEDNDSEPTNIYPEASSPWWMIDLTDDQAVARLYAQMFPDAQKATMDMDDFKKFMNINQHVNAPSPLKDVFYPAFGGDITNVIASTGSPEIYVVDKNNYLVAGLKDLWNRKRATAEFKKAAAVYLRFKRMEGFAPEDIFDIQSRGRKLPGDMYEGVRLTREEAILIELESLGLTPADIETGHDQESGLPYLKIKKMFQGHKASETTFYFLPGTDLRLPDHYPRELLALIARGVSCYFQHALNHQTDVLLSFMPILGKIVKKGGFWIVDDEFIQLHSSREIMLLEQWMEGLFGAKRKDVAGGAGRKFTYGRGKLVMSNPEPGQDHAMNIKSKGPGGIDLTPADKVLQTQNTGGGAIKFHMDPAMLAQLQNAPGFVPVIISIRPMTDLKAFLLT